MLVSVLCRRATAEDSSPSLVIRLDIHIAFSIRSPLIPSHPSLALQPPDRLKRRSTSHSNQQTQDHRMVVLVSCNVSSVWRI
ncbi:hypothetical protein PGT21_034362 [Puccinia graminis f. sp. tritici]|uniref:Uncharacterized protein n=1 Tax=Puccinia graminis f. sp. tritici TaxID=56615 RepID=A0A5B0R4C5_PUCGR|nr:hypothetical protein PGT21_034362 [Puccinia graminis f. sp. tritici]KAA1120310.1 hypothetical protein PGTUg99_011381 [Puccinia graminis f. sp. tritici]